MRACAAAMTLLSSLGALSSARADEGPAATAGEQRGYRPLDSASVLTGSVVPAPVVAPRHRGVGLMRWGAIMAILSYGLGALGALDPSSPPSRFWWLVPLVGGPLSLPWVDYYGGEQVVWGLISFTMPQLIGLLLVLAGVLTASAQPSPPRRTGVQPLLGPGFAGLAIQLG